MNTIPNELKKILDQTKPVSESIKNIEEIPINFNRDPEFVADYLKSKFINEILEILDKKNISKSDLAKLMGKSRQYISRILNETVNFTLDTLAQISCALDEDINIKLGSSEQIFKQKDTYKFNISKTILKNPAMDNENEDVFKKYFSTKNCTNKDKKLNFSNIAG
jgi:transcriptional regulator with XRE-family HTH domain